MHNKSAQTKAAKHEKFTGKISSKQGSTVVSLKRTTWKQRSDILASE